MKTYFTDLIPRIKEFRERLDNETLLVDQHWVLIDEDVDDKIVFIFRSNNNLLISTGGQVEKGAWEMIGTDSILIERNDESYLFRHGFLDDKVMALKVDGKKEYVFLVNEEHAQNLIGSKSEAINYLESRYALSSQGNSKASDVSDFHLKTRLEYKGKVQLTDSDIGEFHAGTKDLNFAKDFRKSPLQRLREKFGQNEEKGEY